MESFYSGHSQRGFTILRIVIIVIIHNINSFFLVHTRTFATSKTEDGFRVLIGVLSHIGLSKYRDAVHFILSLHVLPAVHLYWCGRRPVLLHDCFSLDTCCAYHSCCRLLYMACRYAQGGTLPFADRWSESVTYCIGLAAAASPIHTHQQNRNGEACYCVSAGRVSLYTNCA